jgi:phage tail sheath gpL-like
MSGTITFSKIPTTLLLPGVFAEFDPQGGNSNQPYRSLIIGQKLASGAAPVGVPLICSGAADAVIQGGAGSHLAIATAFYIAGDDFGELWYLPLADDSAAVAATGLFTVTAVPTDAAVIPLYITGVLVPVKVSPSATSTVTLVAAAIVAAVNANLNLPVTAANTAGAVTITAKNKGPIGNDLDYRLSYYGIQGGDVMPTGLAMTGILSGTGTQLTGGAQNPTTFAAALANLSDQAFDFVCQPYVDAVSLNAWQSFMDDNTGRWAWDHMVYGGGFSAMRGTYGAATAFGVTRNDPAMDITPIYDAPQPVWAWAARIMADCAVSLRANPAVPLQYLIHDTLMPPPLASRFISDERQVLLQDGMSTFTVNAAGQVVSERHVTTYQTNASGEPDTSYQDVETRYTLAYVCRDLKSYIQGLYGRKIFVDDNTRLSGTVNNAIVMPSMIKASVISRYRYLEGLGLVQDGDAFAAAVQVQKTGSMARVYWPGDLANQLRQVAFAIAFSKT